MSTYHAPVLLHESVDALIGDPDGTYVDVTYGGGGHSRLILSKLSPKGRLISFDRDKDAVGNVTDDQRFTLVHHNFLHIKQFLRYFQCLPVDGILGDLGISSHQIDEGERGFSHRFNGPLDMRMDQNAPLDATFVVNQYDEKSLGELLYRFGEMPQARKVAKIICQARLGGEINTTEKLKEAVAACTPKATPAKFYSQLFQAIRIEVNGELKALENLLQESENMIKLGGKLVVISYHSLEDRLVKNYLNTGNLDGKRITDLYGAVQRPFTPSPSRAIVPGDDEIAENKRARSAKLRIGVRN